MVHRITVMLVWKLSYPLSSWKRDVISSSPVTMFLLGLSEVQIIGVPHKRIPRRLNQNTKDRTKARNAQQRIKMKKVKAMSIIIPMPFGTSHGFYQLNGLTNDIRSSFVSPNAFPKDQACSTIQNMAKSACEDLCRSILQLIWCTTTVCCDEQTSQNSLVGSTNLTAFKKLYRSGNL